MDEIKESLDQIDFDERFPIYSSLMKPTLKKCTHLAQLLVLGYESLKNAFGDFKMPDLVLYNISSFLNRKDLEILNSVFEMKG